MSEDIEEYLDLITSEHRDKPKFVATVSIAVQGNADTKAVAGSLIVKYDLDDAVGVQLDVIGLWVGASRYLQIPLTGVYFSLDTDGLGFDEGTWLGPFDPITGLVALPDDAYRTLIRATIAANQWDGTIPQAYEIWDSLFASESLFILIQDNEDMTMTIGLYGSTPDAVTLALLTGGYLSLKPEGVRITGYVIPSVPGDPFFGFDAQNENVAGFDTGCWPTLLMPT